MKLQNSLHYDNGLIEYILQSAGCDTTRDFTLVVESLSVELAAQCGEGTRGLMFEVNGTYYVQVDNGAGLDILAHELKHVEQYVSGLGEWLRAERELTDYDARWYEQEANEFGSKWR
jgi:hypothetical protein